MASDFIRINSPLPVDYFRTSIVLKYQYNHKTFRYYMFRVEEKYFLPKMCALRVAPEVYDARYEVARMERLAADVNRAIIALSRDMGRDDTLTKAKVDAWLAQEKGISSEAGKPLKVQQKSTSFVADFEAWIEQFREKKRQEEVMRGLVPRKNHPTVKDYVSACNLLKDFQSDRYGGRAFTFRDVTPRFIEELILYAYESRGDDDDDDADADGKRRHLTQGSLSNKTLNKRFDCIFSFILNFYRKLPEGVEKKPRLETIDKKIIRLDRDELRQLENLRIREEHKEYNYEFYRDCLVFLCYTGLRFGDFHKLNRSYYHEEDNLIVLETEKTRKHCEVFLFAKAKEIAEKYNFDFKPIYNQTLNRGIKSMLEAYDLFPEEITIDYMGAGGRRTISKKKREFISCHTGRRTFMSIMIENGMDIYDLISMTGHAPNSTSLKRYIDLFGKQRMEKFRLMDGKLK